MRIGQKHNKIKHVENIEKADVSCETMQNSPKSKRRKRRWALVRAQERRGSRAAVKACVAARRSVWVCARSGSVSRQGVASKENIGRKALRRKNKGGFERCAGKTGREERREDGTNMRKIALLQGALRGRSSYKWADNGKEGEKSAEKLTIENKFHMKQFFAARVSHET